MRPLGIALLFVLSVAPFSSAIGVESATRVVVDKSDRLLMLYRGPDLLGSFRVALGSEPVGAKRLEGDGRTPEGTYVLDRKQASDRYYKSIHISYPNPRDLYMAEQKGGVPGWDVKIHGQPKRWTAFAWLTQLFDWTDGCIALSNKDMDQVWASVKEGTPIEITP